jgi:hypothetical protein
LKGITGFGSGLVISGKYPLLIFRWLGEVRAGHFKTLVEGKHWNQRLLFSMVTFEKGRAKFERSIVHVD